MDDDNYTPAWRFTLERIVATLLVAAWVGTGFFIGGLPLAIRAVLLFMVPLSFILLPDILVRIAGVATRKSLAPDTLINELALRLVAWTVIIGVPAAWFISMRS